MCKRHLTFTPKNHCMSACVSSEPVRHLGKSVREPSFCRAKSGAGINAEYGSAQYSQHFTCLQPLLKGEVDHRLLTVRSNAGRSKKVQIVCYVVNLTVFAIKGNSVRKEKAPSVPVITNPLRNPRKIGNQRGVKSILQEYGHRKFSRPKQPGQPELPY